MKLNLPLKLAIGIVVVFGLLFIGMALYLPVWYKVQKWRLKSDNPTTRKAAAITLAAEGKRAIPHIKKWLQSGNDRLVISACCVLEKMKDETWQDALCELEKILDGSLSEKTSAAAKVVFEKGYACNLKYSGVRLKLNWKHFKQKKRIKRNICSYILSEATESKWREFAAKALGEIKDTRALVPLIIALERDSASSVRWRVAEALGKLGDIRAVDPLINALGKDPDPEVKGHAANAIGMFEDTRAIVPLITALKNDSSHYVQERAAEVLGEFGDHRAVAALITALEKDSDLSEDGHAAIKLRGNAAVALGKIGDPRAVGPLVAALKDNWNEVRGWATWALGELGDARAVLPLINFLEDNSTSYEHISAVRALDRIGDTRAIGPIIKAMESHSDPKVRNRAAVALAWFKDKRINNALAAAAHKKNAYAKLMLAWRKGGEHLVSAGSVTLESDIDLETSLAIVHARWGNASAIERVFHTLEYFRLYPFPERFTEDILSRMPDGFPVFDFNAKYAVRKRCVRAIIEWYKKNKSRLAWNEKTRRYYLRD
jgi:HEAT repeat protein